MFNHTHYVPILRWKRGERIALENLRAQHRRKMTPLLEVVPKDFAPNREGIPRAPNRVLAQKADEVRTCWGRDPFFLDLQLLQPPLAGAKQAHPLVVFGEEARARQLRLVPVTGLTRSPTYQSAVASLVKTDNQGACIRVTPKDIQCATFPRDLQRLLSDLRIEPTQVDLLVDYGVIDNSSPAIERECPFDS